MSELTDRQAAFAQAVAALILKAHALGYRVRLGDCYRSPEVKYGHPKSTHRNRLAVDIMVDRKDAQGNWRWCEDWREYAALGEWWEAEYREYDAAWGGRFQERDAVHFSFPWGGVK